MGRFRSQRALGNDGKAIELGKDLGVKLDVSVVSLKMGFEHLTALDGFTVPSLLPKGLGHGLQLE